MKARPYSKEQIAEFERMTADLSIEGKGVWVVLRMRMCLAGLYTFTTSVEHLMRLWHCTEAQVLTLLKELELSTTCGLRVEHPPPEPPAYEQRTSSVRLVYEPDEKVALFSSSESLRLQKYREDKKNEEKMKIPENWELSEKNKEFARANGMSTATVQHEFEKCKVYHAERQHTKKGWESLVWCRWVLNWVSYGKVQVITNGSGNGLKPPPFPPKTHPIERNQWRMAYGDPKQYGYSTD